MFEQERPDRKIRASFTDRTIIVYQAYSVEIASRAVAAGAFVAPFKRDRMTWIKPSFLWMMYRSGWATKPGQERVLAVEILRSGFEWALQHACLSNFEAGSFGSREEWAQRIAEAPVRIQWDPERSITLDRLNYRTIQVGLSGPAVNLYVDEWITSITDITLLAREVHGLVEAGELEAASALLPRERAYPISEDLKRNICGSL
jgi:hypothetical protein